MVPNQSGQERVLSGGVELDHKRLSLLTTMRYTLGPSGGFERETGTEKYNSEQRAGLPRQRQQLETLLPEDYYYYLSGIWCVRYQGPPVRLQVKYRAVFDLDFD